ncbi:MAG: uracil-DNA glycosylase [Opitutaceae bacterium]|nr:uracil-DNA glycosylase [Opitutaceae bacterium]
MNDAVAAVVEELQRLKRSGVSNVYVSDEALTLLRRTDAVHADVRREPSPQSQDAPPAGAVDEPAAEAVPAIPPQYAGTTGAAAAASFSKLLATIEQTPAHPSMKKAASAAIPATSPATGKLPPPPVIQLPEGTKRERWEWLRQRVLDCPVCKAHTPAGLKVVFGVGSIDADIFFCGEAPGGEEEIQGEPFVGPAGQLLTKMIVAMGLTREKVYIGNILNWRPQMDARASGKSVSQVGNRPPTEEEMSFGLPYLRAQIEVVQPKVIVALGSTAAQGLLGFGSFKSLGSIRGKWQQFCGTPLMVTYHPSYLLRYGTPQAKRQVWEDLLQVMDKVGLPISEKQRGYFK